MTIKTVLVVLLTLVLTATGVIAQDGGGESVEVSDEVVREVVRMLDAGVDEEVIVLWLERDGRRPKAVSADDLIALTRSNASRELIDALMEAGAAVPAPGPPERMAEPSVASQPAPRGDAIPLELSITYRPFRDPEGDEDEQWQLFVYLDGRPLAWSDGKNWLSRSKRNREVSVLVSARRHVVRLVEERHRRRAEGWTHEARVCPVPIELDATAGPLEIEIEIKEAAGLGFGKAVYRWARLDGDDVEDTRLPGPPETWAPLCEEIESNYTYGRKIPRRVKKQLEDCVRWHELWPADADAPDRGTVRSQLERHDFRPVLTSR